MDNEASDIGLNRLLAQVIFLFCVISAFLLSAERACYIVSSDTVGALPAHSHLASQPRVVTSRDLKQLSVARSPCLSVSSFSMWSSASAHYSICCCTPIAQRKRSTTHVHRGRDHRACLSTCVLDGHVPLPPRKIHCVFVSSTEVLWCRTLSALRWP